MKRGVAIKSIGLFVVVVASLYLVTFYGCEYWRRQRGPWELHFNTDARGHPSVVVYQPKLNISSVELLFLGETLAETNLSKKVSFDRTEKTLPFGRLLYADLTVLPGVITFDFFGHEVEILPRALLVNKRQIAWQSERVVELTPANKPAQPPQPPKNWQPR